MDDTLEMELVKTQRMTWHRPPPSRPASGDTSGPEANSTMPTIARAAVPQQSELIPDDAARMVRDKSLLTRKLSRNVKYTVSVRTVYF